MASPAHQPEPPLDLKHSTAAAGTPVGWGLAAAAALTLASLPGGYLLLNVVSDRQVLAWSLALAVPAIAFAVSGRRLVTTWPARRRSAIIRLGLVSLLLGWIVLRMISAMQLTFTQIEAAMSGSDLPDGFELVREERRGDRLCRDHCPRIQRYYRTPPGMPDPVRAVVLSLYRHGWSPEDPAAPREANTAVVKDGIRAHVLVVGPDELRIYLDAWTDSAAQATIAAQVTGR